MTRRTYLVVLPVLSLLVTVVPCADAQPGTHAGPPKPPREQVEMLLHHRATTSFAELAAIVPPGLDVIVTVIDAHGVHSHMTRGSVASIAPDGLTLAVRRRFGRWRQIPLVVADIHRVDLVHPSRRGSRTRTIVTGVAGVTGLALMAGRRTGAGLLVLFLPMMAMEHGQVPGPPPRRQTAVSQVDGVLTTTLYIAPDTFTSS